MDERDGRVTLAAAGWMTGIGLLLYFVPVLNGLVGGFVGGRRTGRLGPAMLAAVLASVALAAFTWAFRTGVARSGT